MPLVLYQRAGVWHVRGSVRGLRIRQSTGVRDKSQAEEIRIKLEGAALTRSVHGEAVARTFAEAALSYGQNGGEIAHLERLIRHFGQRPLQSIGQAELEDAALKLFRNKSPATVNRQLYTPVVAVLRHAARKRWCSRPVIKRPTQPKGRIRWITPEEAERLTAAAAPHLKPLVIFLLSTGARLSEALYLDWRDVDLAHSRVTFAPNHVRGIKNGESRGVPLHPRAKAALASVPWDKTGAVFRKPVGDVWLDTRKRNLGMRRWVPYASRDGAGGGQVKTAWSGMCRRAGIEDFTPHDCRHTWATWHYAANRDLLALMKLGGWKSLAMVERYAHVNVDQLAPTIEKIWEVKNAG